MYYEKITPKELKSIWMNVEELVYKFETYFQETKTSSLTTEDIVPVPHMLGF